MAAENIPATNKPETPTGNSLTIYHGKIESLLEMAGDSLLGISE